MLIAACLVFLMNAGFAMLEAGASGGQNTVNILAKNLLVFCTSALAFWVLGFGLMFSDSNNGFVSLNGFLTPIVYPTTSNPLAFPLEFNDLRQDWSNYSFTVLFFFQLLFAGIAATIVSGAVLARIKFVAFIFFSLIFVGIFYPLVGHWVWSSNGWLKNSILNFHDFAGATVVHSVGGMAALVGTRLLGPRSGLYNAQKGFSVAPYNPNLSVLGCIILWLGWFGFNGGSTQQLENIPHIIVTTMMSAVTGGLAVLCWSGLFTQPNLLSVINGILGGLVAITASSAFVDMKDAFLIGAISGIVILIGEYILKLTQTDDPVGVIPVHLFCGLWGTVAVGIFATPNSPEFSYQYNWVQQTFNQFIGWLTICIFIGVFSWITWIVIGIVLYHINQDYYLNHLPPKNYLSLDSKEKIPHRLNFNFAHNNYFFGKQKDWYLQLYKWIEIGRKGIRVSPYDEQRGSDGFF